MKITSRLWTSTRWLLMLVLCISVLLTGVVSVSAQGVTPTPINIGDNETGELSTTDIAISYSLAVPSPQFINVQVLSLTDGFAPAFSIFDPAGVLIRTAANAENLTSIESTQIPAAAGTYRIEVRSANGIPGEFVVSVQGGQPIPEPQSMIIGDVISANVNSESSYQSYAFTGSELDVLVLTVQSDNAFSGPSIVLKDSDSGETLAVSSPRLLGARWQIAAGILNYRVEITHSGSPNTETYTICLESANAAPICPQLNVTSVGTTDGGVVAAPTTQSQLPTLLSTGPCVVASASGGSVNIRSGPATGFAVVTQLTSGATAPVSGRLADNSWYQVNVNGIVGWISGSVVRVGGQCGTIPAITLTPAPGGSATSTPTSAATSAVTATPTATATSTATVSPSPSPTLNFSLAAVFGSTALTSGFVPDPFTVGITGGGPANVSYLGSGCAGYTTSAPSYSVNYTSGSFTLLRFYFIGSGDTTMVVNTPSASYFCVDDSFGTLNPTLDFNSPASGRYDVWIGTFTSGASVGGTLYVTESSANHP